MFLARLKLRILMREVYRFYRRRLMERSSENFPRDTGNRD